MNTHLFFIIDRSGSMEPRISQVHGGFREFIQEQKRTSAAGIVSVLFFDTESKLVIDKKPLDEIYELEKNSYIPGGCTALYDAIGKTLSNIKKKDGEEIIVIVITDGEENSSVLYNQRKIKNLIKETKDFVKIVFMGSNQDAILNGKNLGVDVSLDFDDDNLQTAMRNTSAAVSRYRSQATQTIEYTQIERETSVGDS